MDIEQAIAQAVDQRIREMVGGAVDAAIDKALARRAAELEHEADQDARLITFTEARKLVRVSASTLHAAVTSGDLPSQEVGECNLGTKRLFRRGDVIAWRDARLKKGGK